MSASISAVDRKSIARIIDPAAWRTHDDWAARLRGEGNWPTDPDQVEAIRSSYERRMPYVVAESLAKADAILALHPPVMGEVEAENERLREQVASLQHSVTAFCAPWAVQYARTYGLPENHLHPTHYDILADAGARMDDFTRATLSTEQVR